MTLPPFLTNPQPAPVLLPRPWKPMPIRQIAKRYGKAYAAKVKTLRTITEKPTALVEARAKLEG